MSVTLIDEDTQIKLLDALEAVVKELKVISFVLCEMQDENQDLLRNEVENND